MARGAQVAPPAPELHAARLYDPALPAAEELSRLNRALLAAFTQLLGYVRRYSLLVAPLGGADRESQLSRALGAGESGYDARVHDCAVLLSNCGALLNDARQQQAASVLEAQLRQALAERRDALAQLRAAAAAAEAQAQAAAAALPSLSSG